jgi:hypothetical protein
MTDKPIAAQQAPGKALEQATPTKYLRDITKFNPEYPVDVVMVNTVSAPSGEDESDCASAGTGIADVESRKVESAAATTQDQSLGRLNAETSVGECVKNAEKLRTPESCHMQRIDCGREKVASSELADIAAESSHEGSGPATGGGDTDEITWVEIDDAYNAALMYKCECATAELGCRFCLAWEKARQLVVKLERQRDEAIRESDKICDSYAIENQRLFDRAEAAEREAEALRKDAEKWRSHIAKNETWEKLFEYPPCFVCGYNGPGYFQPDNHPCAKLYHEAIDEAMKK